MDKVLQDRRSRWLKIYNPKVIENISILHGTYMEAELETFAKYKLAELRLKQINDVDDWDLKKEIILQIVLFLLGASIFAILPRIGLSKTLNNALLTTGTVVFGYVITLISHTFVSSFFSKSILYNQYKSVLNELEEEEERAGGRKFLSCFLQNQINFFKKVESPHCKATFVWDWLSLVFAVFLEVGAIYVAFTRNDSEDINYIVMFLGMAVSIFILLGISSITSKKKNIPKVNESIKTTYSNVEDEIINQYRK